jgi:hypothetical protein
VATSVFHQREVARRLGPDVLGLMVSPGYLFAVRTFAELSDDDALLVICPSEEGVRAIRRALRETGARVPVRHVTDWSDAARVRRRAEASSAVLVSRSAIDGGVLDVLEGVPVSMFSYDLDPAAIEVVREALIRHRGATEPEPG